MPSLSPALARRLVLAAVDAVLLALAWYFAYLLRFDFALQFEFPEADYADQCLALLPWVVIIHVGLFAALKLYRGLPRFASLAEARTILIASGILCAGLYLFNLLIEGRESFLALPVGVIQGSEPAVFRIPLTIPILYFLLSAFLTGGFRFSRRLWTEGRTTFETDAVPTLMVGTGDLADKALREVLRSSQSAFRPVALVSRDGADVGASVQGVRVRGAIEDIPRLLRELDVRAVLIALDDDDPAVLREVVAHCNNASVDFHIIPTLRDISAGRVDIRPVRRVRIEDLLGREPVTLQLPEERNYLRDETVLITGAGGSVGSELARQAAAAGPRRLVLSGKGENSLLEIAGELRRTAGNVEVVSVVADVRDESAMLRLFLEHRPSIVLHAAAHKHVPLMEAQPAESVKNNVLGTAVVAWLAHETGAKRFVLISTDKAVRPVSVLGATKRLAEQVVFSLAQESDTVFQAVRFGNVLGSRGSVIPLLQAQIAAGGPVTVTHPDATRFFMTVSEAVSLVLQAGSEDRTGSLFLLDMGRPVRVLDLVRNLITLSGLREGRDIEISYIGLRPGEKLHEELLTEAEDAKATGIGKVLVTTPRWVADWDQTRELLKELRELADAASGPEILARLRDEIPDYTPAGLDEDTDEDALRSRFEAARESLAAAAARARAELALASAPVAAARQEDLFGSTAEAAEPAAEGDAEAAVSADPEVEPVFEAADAAEGESSPGWTGEALDEDIAQPAGKGEERGLSAIFGRPETDESFSLEEAGRADPRLGAVVEDEVTPQETPAEVSDLPPPDFDTQETPPAGSLREALRGRQDDEDDQLIANPSGDRTPLPEEFQEAAAGLHDDPFRTPKAGELREVAGEFEDELPLQDIPASGEITPLPEEEPLGEPVVLLPEGEAAATPEESREDQEVEQFDDELLPASAEKTPSVPEDTPDFLEGLIEEDASGGPAAGEESLTPEEPGANETPPGGPDELLPPGQPEAEAEVARDQGEEPELQADLPAGESGEEDFLDAAHPAPEESAPEPAPPATFRDEDKDQDMTEQKIDAPVVYLALLDEVPGEARKELFQHLGVRVGTDAHLIVSGVSDMKLVPPSLQERTTLLPTSLTHPPAQWNAASKMVSEDALIVALGPNVRLNPEFRQTLEKFANDNPDALLMYCDHVEQIGGKEEVVKLHDHNGCPHERFEFGPVMVYRNKALRELGGFDESLQHAWEYDMHLRLMQEGYIKRIPNPQYKVVLPEREGPAGALYSPGRGKLGGFSYVFYPEDVEKEVTTVFEKALKQIGAWIDHPTAEVPQPKEQPEVMATVVIPVLNRVKYIGNAINKVREGTFDDFEVVVIDNGSTDGTVEEVKKIAAEDPRIRLIHGTGGSIASALNEGIKAARGKYICQLDSDDQYAPTCLERMIGHLESHPKCGLAISYYRLMNENAEVIEDVAPITHAGYTRNQILRRDGAGALRVFPKAVLEEFGYYDEEHYGNFGEDYDMVVKTGEKYDVDRVHEVLYYYRRHEDNTDVTRDPEMKYHNKNRARQEALRRRMKINEELGKTKA